ncbi:unnamed protein product, partial [Symbiodinium sp. KB8]
MMRTQSLQLEEMREVIHEDFSMGVVINLSLKGLLEDFGMRETINLSLKDLLEDFGMGEMSNLNPKDLLEDFGVRAMRDLNVRVIFENLSILQACRGMEVNVVSVRPEVVIFARGLHQLQQVQLDKMDKRSADEDWLEVIDGPPLRDISDSSSWWWDSVKKRACDRMLLQAMAETVRAEMVASESEKAYILQYL